ncbi:hypothetical protein KSD_53000 [Ktedonobacter sp. SOSP1-85]|nr:hypothetical protein KSD_53000 [Ktedonobacter sp. SOSP1-85]
MACAGSITNGAIKIQRRVVNWMLSSNCETEQEDFTRRWDVVIDNTGLQPSETREKIMQCVQQKYPDSL